MDVRKKKIIFVMPSLSGGGAERVMLSLVKHIDKQKFEPIFVLMKKEGRFLNLLPKELKVINLNSSNARYAIFKIAKVIRDIKPDIVFSTLGHLNLLIAVIKPFFSKEIKFISRESNTVSLENRQEKYPKLFNWLYRNVYNNFDQIITQSKYMRDDLIKNFGIKKEKIFVIYNPVDIEEIDKKSQQTGECILPKDKINLIAVGRLTPQKGFDILIDALNYLDDRFYLSIFGEGDDKSVLQEKIIRLGLIDKITLHGFSNNPYPFMKNGNLFILSSRYEGLPNVVLEANACGLACVAFDTPGGTAEIIKENKTGVLVKKFEALSLANAINTAIKSDFDSKYIKKYCTQNFNVSKIVQKYEAVFFKKVGSDDI